MATDLAAVRAENQVSITLRRGGSSLEAQPVRIARMPSQGRVSTGELTQESRGRVVVLGGTDLDIQPDDRFTDADGALYRVVLVRPNRRAAVIAEAEVIE
jgi:hypothetical protein